MTLNRSISMNSTAKLRPCRRADSIDRMQQLIEHRAVRQVGQAVMRRQIFDPLVGLAPFRRRDRNSRARRRHCWRAATRSSTSSGVNASRSLDMKTRTPAAWPRLSSGKAAPDFVAFAPRPVMKGGAPLVGEIIVDDARLQGPKRGSAHPAPFGTGVRDRDLHRLLHFALRARPGDDVQEVVARFAQGDDGRGEPAALHRRFANQLEQFLARAGAHDRFVGRA